MKQHKFNIFLIVCGSILLLGLMIMFVSFGSSRYYQEQNYNHLPSISQPQEITHYKEKVDEANTLTELNNIAEKLPDNTTVIINNSTLFSDFDYIFDYILVRENRTTNVPFYIFLFASISAYYFGFMPSAYRFGISTKNKLMASIILGTGFSILSTFLLRFIGINII